MTVTVKHTKTSGVADGTDPTQIQPSDWNADHTLVGFTKLAGLDAMGAGLGLVTQTAPDIFTTRSLVAGTGIGITNPAGTGGNITIAVTGSYQAANSKLTGLAAMGAGIGLVVQTALDTFTTRSLAAGTGITISNPTGSGGNPSIALDTANPLTFTGGVTINMPTGFTALTLISNDGTATGGPNLVLQRISPTPAAADILAQIYWYGADSALAQQQYGAISMTLMDPTAGAIQGRINFQTAIANAFATRWRIESGFYYGGGADTGANRVNVLGLDIAGTDIFARTNIWTGANTFSSGTNLPVQIQWDDPGAGVGPWLSLYRNSTSPAAGDVIGSIAAIGKNVAGTSTTYTALYTELVDPTTGAEDSGFLFQTIFNGAGIQPWRMRQGFYYGAGADPGSGRINVIDDTGLRIAGTSIFARANVWTADQLIQKAAAAFTVDATSGTSQVVIRGVAGTVRILRFYTAANERWRISADGAAESGSNAGSNFAISPFDDSGGGFSGIGFNIARATGAVTISSIGASTTNLTLNSTDDGATGTLITANHITASPAASDNLFQFTGLGRDTGAAAQSYGSYGLLVTDPTAGSEDSRWYFNTVVAGTIATRFNIGAGLYAQGLGDPGASNINVLDLQINNVSIADVGFIWTAVSHQFGNNSGPFTMYFRAATSATIDMQSIGSGANTPVINLGHVGSNNASGNGTIRFQSNNNTGLFTYSYITQVTTNGTVGAESGDINILTMNGGAFVTHKIGANGSLWGAATGGQKGPGTFNAVSVWANGTALTCYVLEAANNNNIIDLERWDQFDVGGRHNQARRFQPRAARDLDVDQYIDQWKRLGVLPGWPTPEEWERRGGESIDVLVQRLWETVEIFAVHIDTVNTRAKAA